MTGAHLSLIKICLFIKSVQYTEMETKEKKRKKEGRKTEKGRKEGRQKKKGKKKEQKKMKGGKKDGMEERKKKTEMEKEI